MADKTKFDDSLPPLGGEPSDLDPFAELKRIMGLEAQEPAKSTTKADATAEENFVDAPSPVEAMSQPADAFADDFGIDLERELMGEFLADDVSVVTPVVAAVEAAPADEDEADFDAAFAEDVGSLEAAFQDQPQSQAELDVDLADLDAVFAQAEAAAEIEEEKLPKIELSPVVAQQKPVEEAVSNLSAVASDEVEELDFDDVDFGDLDSVIAKEMDQALTASFAVEPAVNDDDLELQLEEALDDDLTELETAGEPKSSDGLADVDMDFDTSVDWSVLDAPKADVKTAEATVETTKASAMDNTDELLAALEAAAKKITDKPGAETKSAASNEDPFVALAKMSDQYQSRGNQYDWRQPVRNTQPRAAAPEVETTEMFDQAFSMADDLDLPEVRYDEPAQAVSDIDLEFDNLLNEMSRSEPARPVRTAAPEMPRYETRGNASQQTGHGLDDFDFDSAFAQPASQAAQPNYRTPEAAPQPRQAYQSQPQDDLDLGDFDFDDNDFDDQEPVQQAAYRPHDRGGRGGRGMMIAAIVGGVALLGGIGAMAMSWTGESGAPAMVKADSSPVKIRPENPGGSSVPNQDSAVYDTVSRSGAQQPSQERLVSATEDPIALPQPDDSETDEVASLAKGEDRVAASEADEAPAQDALAVAPRKVRTMIVKPDGSLVPAEEPAAAAPAEPSVEDIASAPVEEPEQITTGATQPTPAEPEAETVAAAPAPSGWAVQIASQPNEDGANKSMKSMSKKYSGVIGERGLHIVKADVPNKGTYWRVRVAAASRDDAVSVCSNIKSAGGSCFVTR